MRGLATAGLMSGVVVAAFAMGRRSCRHSADPGAEIGDDVAMTCLATTADVAALLEESPRGEVLHQRWGGLHARLVDLERRTTQRADAAPDLEAGRPFDQLAGTLISLRTALEAGVRLRLDHDPTPCLIEAADGIVIVRCEDVNVTARTLSSV